MSVQRYTYSSTCFVLARAAADNWARGRGLPAQSKTSTAALFLFIPIARGASRPDKDADGRRREGELGSGSLIGFPPSGSRKQSSIYVLKSIETHPLRRNQAVPARLFGTFCPRILFFSLSLV